MNNNTSIKTLDRVSSINLPEEWKGTKIFVREYNDTIVIKKMEMPEFWNTWEKVKPLVKKINSKDIEKAIKWAKKT